MDREIEEEDPLSGHKTSTGTDVYEDVEFLGRDETDSMTPDALDEVLKKAYEDCERNVLSRPVPDGQFHVHSLFFISISFPGKDIIYCPANFDGWGCWNDTPAGTTAYIPCPTVQVGFNPERKLLLIEFV